MAYDITNIFIILYFLFCLSYTLSLSYFKRTKMIFRYFDEVTIFALYMIINIDFILRKWNYGATENGYIWIHFHFFGYQMLTFVD